MGEEPITVTLQDMQSREWIKPNGKTQGDIDAEKIAELKAEDVRQAREYLERTQDDVLKVMEDFLEAQGAIDAALLKNRRQARQKMMEERL